MMWLVTSKMFKRLFTRRIKHGSLTSSIFVAQVRKSPNVSQVHREANDRQQKVYFLAPGFSLLVGHGSGVTREVAGGGDDGGAGVLDAILVLHQDQFYLFFLHIALFQRGHRRQLVFWQNLDVHLLCGWGHGEESRAGPAPSQPPLRELVVWVAALEWGSRRFNPDRRACSADTTAETSACMGWREEGRQTTDFGQVWCWCVKLQYIYAQREIQVRTASRE